MFLSRHMPCDDCGESVERTAAESHVCNPERLLDYQMFRMRDEAAAMRDMADAELADARVQVDARITELLAELEREPTIDELVRDYLGTVPPVAPVLAQPMPRTPRFAADAVVERFGGGLIGLGHWPRL